MTTNRWLLPDGVSEVLPAAARTTETLRRNLLDLYHSYGYELVEPPLIEYTDSLLIGLGEDMDLHSFKMADQISGRLLAVRPDITPQVARIDAHSLAREGVSRFCYAGSVLHTVPLGPMSSRSPVQIGAELYGEPSVAADIELISLMLATVRAAGYEEICLDIGHVAIYKAMVEAAAIPESVLDELFAVLQRKAGGDLEALLESADVNDIWRQRFTKLAGLHGDITCLDEVDALFDNTPSAVCAAIDQCRQVVAAITASFDKVSVFIDFSELRGFHYHTGLVFAAYVDGVGQAVANGGRYDDIGSVFGRARAATGFSSYIDLLISGSKHDEVDQFVYVDAELLAQAGSEIAKLREQGVAVVEGFAGGQCPESCTHQLVFKSKQWLVEPVKE